MRWLPDRERSPHWALELLQIAQGMLLSAWSVMIVLQSITEPSFRKTQHWLIASSGVCVFAVGTWVIYWARFGWTVTLLITVTVAGLLHPITTTIGGLEQFLVWQILSVAVGGLLDMLTGTTDLATEASVEYSKASIQSPDCGAEPTEPTPPIAGDSP